MHNIKYSNVKPTKFRIHTFAYSECIFFGKILCGCKLLKSNKWHEIVIEKYAFCGANPPWVQSERAVINNLREYRHATS